MLVEPANVPKTRRTSVPVLVRPWRTIAGTTTTSPARTGAVSSPTRPSPSPSRMIRNSSALSVWTARCAPGSSSKYTLALAAVPVALAMGKPTRTRLAGSSSDRICEVYEYFDSTSDMMTSVLRDAEVDPLVREIVDVRRAGPMLRVREELGRNVRGKRALAALDVAVDFHAWKRLAAAGLRPREAAETMTAAILAQ